MEDFKNLHLSNQLCFALYSATHEVTKSYRKHLSEIGLTYPQYLVMLVLWQYQDQHINNLADRLRFGQSTLIPILNRLESVGFIIRKTECKEIISLTARGKEIQQQTSQIQQQVSCETGLTEQEYVELRDRLESMLENFKFNLKRKLDAVLPSESPKQTDPTRRNHVKAFYTAKQGK
ncbi:MAG TPA: MarR family winged helix-turn-helix transcriptional regulator [Methylotenera sp.]|nr:MarR family winged helix-turn-helix transcriptional regulator [Methylotenera sp.]